MGETIEERSRHLGIAEHARPLAEGEVGGDDDRGLLVEPADQVEEELPARWREGQIAELVQDHEVKSCKMVGDAALAGGSGLALEPVHEVDDIVEAGTGAAADAAPGDGGGEMRLARS